MNEPATLGLTQAVAASLRESCAQGMDFAARIVAARHAISSAVVDGCDLEAMWRESDPDLRLAGGYRRHQVVSDPDYGFTVVVLLWEPGAITPIHDHDTWCIFGVLEGELEVTNYHVLEDDGKGILVLEERDRAALGTGILGDNGLPQNEVHRVRNTGAARAISLHVYGADLTRRKAFDGRSFRVAGKEGCMAFQGQAAY